MGSKLIEILGIVTSVGLFGYPPTFLITDTVKEVKGKEATRFFNRLTTELDAVAVLKLILPLWVPKIFFALLDIPFVYPGVRWLASEMMKTMIPTSGKTGKPANLRPNQIRYLNNPLTLKLKHCKS